MEPCPRANGSVPPFGGESLTVGAVMVNDDRVKETCAHKPWMLFERRPRLPLGILKETEKGKRARSEDSPKASIKGKRVTDRDRVSGYKLSGGLNYAGDRGKLKGQRMETNPSNQRLLGSIVLWRAKIPKKTQVSLVVQLEINLLKVAMTLKEGVLDLAKHSIIIFKENDPSNTIELADDDRTKVLDSDVPLAKPVNNMVELISSQIGKKCDTRGLKVVEKQLEVEDKVNEGSKYPFVTHVGKDANSLHKNAMKNYLDLHNSLKNIERIIDKQNSEQVARNRLQLKVSIDAGKWLVFQGSAFKGRFEAQDSRNRCNFLELIKLLSSYNEDVGAIVLENVLKKAQYVSLTILKDILSILARKILGFIWEEIGNSNFFCSSQAHI
ncbi:hypothetical protein Godav_028053 [Gossypium davidsonii]|uniref:DUF4371 domain-containing protein n=1 Tax=Gossypium davidsonii TaxID=34287 RepID=A0A7J8RYN1_GOSDV|nr:hypothetical protein [Gossypium davidsonii]